MKNFIAENVPRIAWNLPCCVMLFPANYVKMENDVILCRAKLHHIARANTRQRQCLAIWGSWKDRKCVNHEFSWNKVAKNDDRPIFIACNNAWFFCFLPIKKIILYDQLSGCKEASKHDERDSSYGSEGVNCSFSKN